MNFLTRIKSNLRGGVDCELAQFNLFLGRNGGHKTAHVDAASLALTHQVDEVIGRAQVAAAGGNNWMIGDMVGAEEASVWVYVESSDGEKFRFEMSRADTQTRWGAPGGKPPVPDAFPLRVVTKALEGNADAAARFVLTQASRQIDIDVLPRTIAAAAEVEINVDTFTAALIADVQALNVSAQPFMDQLFAVADRWKAVASLARQEEREAELLVERSRTYLTGTAVSDAEINTIAQQIANAKIGRSVVSECQRLAVLAAQDMAQLEAVNHQIGQLTEQLYAVPDGDVALIEAVIRVQDRLFADAQSRPDTLTQCPACGGVSAGSERLHYVQIAKPQLIAATQAMQAANPQRAQLTQLQQRAAALHQSALSRATQAQQLQEQAASAVIWGDAQLADAEAKLHAMNQQRAAYSQMDAHKQRVAQARVRAEVHEELYSHMRIVLRLLAVECAAWFAGRVQRFLPRTDVFRIQIDTENKGTVRFGLERDGQLHTALSASEWARMITAIAAATVSEDRTKPSVLVLPDRAFDPDTLAQVLDALLAFPGQVLVTSPVSPTYLNDAWKVHHCAGGVQVAAVADDAPKKKRATRARTKAAE